MVGGVERPGQISGPDAARLFNQTFERICHDGHSQKCDQKLAARQEEHAHPVLFDDRIVPHGVKIVERTDRKEPRTE